VCTACDASCLTCASALNSLGVYYAKCSACFSTHILGSDFSCGEKSANCSTSSTVGGCDTCSDGYYLASADCTGCSDGCKTCTSATACTACMNFFALVSSACVACPTNCYSCAAASTCSAN